MNTQTMPQRGEIISAFRARDGSYDGVFLTGGRTTGVFCRTTCPAKKPREENVEFFSSTQAALLAGFRSCKRWRPMEPSGSWPAWLGDLMRDFDAEPGRHWTDQELRDRGLSPERVRRWFQSHHGMTFHDYGRARRLGLALGQIKHGSGVSQEAFQTGYDSLSGFNEAFKRFMGEASTALTDAKVVTLTADPDARGAHGRRVGR